MADHLWKAAVPNILGVPNTYATTGVMGSLTGRTDAFGRELSPAQAVSSAFGLKLGSYPEDVLRNNLAAKTRALISDLDREAAGYERQLRTNRISQAEFDKKAEVIRAKQEKIGEAFREKVQ